MATRRYGISIGEGEFAITEAVGAAVSSDSIELTVDIATTVVNNNGSTRVVSKQEVLDALEKFENHIIKSNWPPA
jgi:hypothetical protein